MGFPPGRTVMRNAGFSELPGEINLPAFMGSVEFDVPFFDVSEKTALREDRFDVLGQVLDRFFERMDAVFQITLIFQKTMGLLRRANEFMHKKKIVGAAVGLFFGAEKLQTFFKLRQ